VSVLLVLLHHFNIAYVLRDTPLAHAFGWDAVHAVVRNGNYGVTMFFVISGYLITSNARRRWGCLGAIDARTFYVSRIARIMPCLLLLLVLVNGLAAAGVPIFRNHAPLGEPVSFWLVNFASLTFWMNVLIGSYGWVNYALGVLWSLSVEEVFYLSFPLLCIALRRDGRLLAFWAFVVAIGPFIVGRIRATKVAFFTRTSRASTESRSAAVQRFWPTGLCGAHSRCAQRNGWRSLE
jgi:peptidoglycan/LPS O-acetylase OafA/YrhL